MSHLQLIETSTLIICQVLLEIILKLFYDLLVNVLLNIIEIHVVEIYNFLMIYG